jgi:type II secretory pathway pseudopilin PulG
VIETKMTQREQTGVATFPGSPEAAVTPRVIPAQAGIHLRSFRSRKTLLAAFTMVELLVALLVMILLLGITAVIYKSSADAITQTNASVAMYQDFNVLTRQIDQSLQNIYTDGYLVIYGYDVGDTQEVAEKNAEGKILFNDGDLPNIRSDAICFFTTGSFNSLTNPNIAANAGWVYLGHAGTVNPATFGSSPFDANSATNPLTVNQWILSKYQIFFTPTQTGLDLCNASMGQYIRNLNAGYLLPYLTAAPVDYEGIRNWFYQNWINDRWENLGLTFWNTPPGINFESTVVGGIPADQTFPFTLGNCGNFKIEFVMPSTFFGANNSLYPATRIQARSDSEPETFEANSSFVWRSAINRNPTLGAEQSNGLVATLTTTPNPIPGEINASTISGGRNNDAIVVFGPRDTWPLMIRFTLRKYDENLSVHSEEDFGTATNLHGGQTFEYTIKLPPKN